MNTYPHDTERRVALRNAHFVRILLRAIEEADHAGSTIKCSGAFGRAEPLHAGMDNGCTDDGQHCLCHCHDDAIYRTSASPAPARPAIVNVSLPEPCCGGDCGCGHAKAPSEAVQTRTGADTCDA